MKLHFFKIYLRFLLKNKVFTLINVLGLAIGIVSFLILIKYVSYQTNYDRFFVDHNQIYRINTHVSKNQQVINETATSFSALAPTLRTETVGVEATTQISYEKCLMDYREKEFKINDLNILWTDNSFFEVFNLNLIQGDKEEVLLRPFTTVISKATSKLYFKNENPIGKIINLNGDDYPLEVTGIFEDIPENSHIKCDFLVSKATGISKGWDSKNGNWNGPGAYNRTYVKLKKEANISVFQDRLSALLKQRYKSKNPEISVRLSLMPIKDIHLKTYFKNEIKRPIGVSIERLYFLSIIAIIIMIVAWVNFINLTIGKTMTRTLEIGIKKTLGAVKSSLIRNFLLESIFMSVLAFIVAVLILVLATLFIFQVPELSFMKDIWTSGVFWFQIVSVMLLGAVFAGVYPAFSLSKLSPTKALKGIVLQQNLYIKKSLIVFQFIAAIGLILGTFTIYDQLTHMKDKKLGFNASNKLIIRAPKSMNSHKLAFSNIHAFKNTVLELPEVENVSASRSIPGQQVRYTSPYFKRLGQNAKTESESDYQIAVIDDTFFDTYSISLLAGKNFTSNYENHKTDIIINETAIKLLGFTSAEEAINQNIIGPKNIQYTIIGVIKDYHQQGLKAKLHPTIYRYYLKYNYIHGHYSIAVNMEATEKLIPAVKDIWNTIYPNDTFEYFFMDDYYNKQYALENNFMRLFFTASFIAILICCMGLYGLSAHTLLQRKKETAIRKIVGASVKDIFILLVKEYAYLILIALFISLPISYSILESWLSNYTYRVNVSPLLILVSVIILVSVVLLTIFKNTWALAKRNPSESVKV